MGRRIEQRNKKEKSMKGKDLETSIDCKEKERNKNEIKEILKYVYVYFQLRTAAFKAYCAIWVIHSNFRYQASPRLLSHERTQRRKVELWARNFR
jgi:hypothetical protein